MGERERFVAFAGVGTEAKIHLHDCIGGFSDLRSARDAVCGRDDEGVPQHDCWGCILDLNTAEVRDWRSDGLAFGRDTWFAPRPMSGTVKRRA